jgi:hypothetical protein
MRSDRRLHPEDGTMYVVCSFPRSGTHFVIDFLRRNFAELHHRPGPIASSETLYYNLDAITKGKTWDETALGRRDVIVKTHALPFKSELFARLDRLAAGRRVQILTPVRDVAGIAASYLRFIGAAADAPDPFFRNGARPAANMETMFAFSLANATLIDVRRGTRDPEGLATTLAARFSLTPRPVGDRCPPRRSSHGLLGEILSRLHGRPSSEVVKARGSEPVRELPSEFVAIARRYDEVFAARAINTISKADVGTVS